MIDLPQIGMGCAPIGGLLGRVSADQARDTLQAALDGGITYFDTAPFYGFGLSERLVGDALRHRADALLSTKVGRLLAPGAWDNPAAHGWPAALPFHHVYDYSYDGVMRSFEDSLQRLGIDRIDLLFLHDIGSFTHVDANEEKRHFKDAMSGGYKALDELRRHGDVKGIGIGVNEIDVSLRVLEHGDWDLFLLAGRYTLLEQEPLEELFPRCEAQNTSIIIGGPYNSGILAGGTTWNYAEAPDDLKQRVGEMQETCTAHGVALPAAALQFCLAHPIVTTVIPGARSAAELQQALKWVDDPIPSAFWSEMKSSGLVSASAPVPT